KLAEWMTALQQATQKAAPQVMELSLRNEVWAGLQAVIDGIVCLIIALALIPVAIKLFKFANENEWDETGVFFGICCVIQAVLCIGFCGNTLNVWSWCAIYDPKTALFHDVFVKLMSR